MWRGAWIFPAVLLAGDGAFSFFFKTSTPFAMHPFHQVFQLEEVPRRGRPYLNRLSLSADGEIEMPETYHGKERDNKYEIMLDMVEFNRRGEANPISMADDPLLPLVHTVIAAADMRKANYLSAFRISHITEVTTFMVIIEGNSRPQNQVSFYRVCTFFPFLLITHFFISIHQLQGDCKHC